MAYSYTVIEFEVGDKVIPADSVMDEFEEMKLSGTETLTIEGVNPTLDPGRKILTFREIPGYWDAENFYLRPETPIRNIDPTEEE